MLGKKKILLLADASRKLLVYAVIFMKNAKSAASEKESEMNKTSG